MYFFNGNISYKRCTREFSLVGRDNTIIGVYAKSGVRIPSTTKKKSYRRTLLKKNSLCRYFNFLIEPLA
jgi:hypothetical protein